MSDYFKKRMEELGMNTTSSSSSNKKNSNTTTNNTPKSTATKVTGKTDYFTKRAEEMGLNKSKTDEAGVRQWFSDASSAMQSMQSYNEKNKNRYTTKYGGSDSDKIKELLRSSDAVWDYLYKHKDELEDYDELKRRRDAWKHTRSDFTARRLPHNLRGQSNGESAYGYFAEKIRGNALYLLDEPENSLSAERQLELARFLEDSARFYGCQFIISTHSPFLLAMRGARVYDLDNYPVATRPWTELPNPRLFFEFFEDHRKEFL